MDVPPARLLMSRLRALTVELDALGADFARRHDLHPTDLRALIGLVEAGRAGVTPTPGALATQLRLDSSSVTALVDRLARRGLLTREPDPADRRRVLLRLSERADELGRAFFEPVIDRGVQAAAGFDAAELAIVDRFLTAVLDAVHEGVHEAGPST